MNFLLDILSYESIAYVFYSFIKKYSLNIIRIYFNNIHKIVKMFFFKYFIHILLNLLYFND
jgi:hypothetical protein